MAQLGDCCPKLSFRQWIVADHEWCPISWEPCAICCPLSIKLHLLVSLAFHRLMAGLGLGLQGIPVPPIQVPECLLHLSFVKFQHDAFPNVGGQPTLVSLQRQFHLALLPPLSDLSDFHTAHEGDVFCNQLPCPSAILSRHPSRFGFDTLGC